MTELLAPLLAASELELVELQILGSARQPIVRAFIDKAGGVTIDDCSGVSRRFSLELDQADLIDGSYTMEVSSPGLDRPLVKPADFRRRCGHRVRVQLQDTKKTLTGTIISADEGLVLETETGRKQLTFAEVEQGLLEF